MNRLVLGAALIAFSTAALAQMPSVKLTAEDSHVIREIVLKDSGVPKTAAANYRIGEEAPATIALQTFPEVVGEKVSAVKSHRFFISGDKVVVVDPKDNRIADIIE